MEESKIKKLEGQWFIFVMKVFILTVHSYKVDFETINILCFIESTLTKELSLQSHLLSVLISLYQLDDENKSLV